MIFKADKAKPVFNEMTPTSSGMKQLTINKSEREIYISVCHFLENAASLREYQSRTCYSTLRMSINALQSFKVTFKNWINSKEIHIEEIALTVEKETEKISHLNTKYLSNLAHVLDLWLGYDIIDDSELLRSYTSIDKSWFQHNTTCPLESTTHPADRFRVNFWMKIVSRAPAKMKLYCFSTTPPLKIVEPILWSGRNKIKYRFPIFPILLSQSFVSMLHQLPVRTAIVCISSHWWSAKKIDGWALGLLFAPLVSDFILGECFDMMFPPYLPCINATVWN